MTAPRGESAASGWMREGAGRDGADVVTALPPREKRFALLIGVSKYKDPQIPQLIAPANDVDRLADALIKSGAFAKEHVFILSTDRPEQAQPEATIILQTLYNLARAAGPDGLLLFAYSGHGYEIEGQAFLLGSDARIIPELKWLQRACVAWSDINEIIIEADVGQVVMLLDACRNDPTDAGELRAANQATQIYERGLRVRRQPSERRAILKLLATQNGEPAYEDTNRKLGFFMSAVVDGLNGKAAGANGAITVAGLWRFVQQEVPSRARLLGRRQRPEAEIEGYDKEQVVLAMAPANSTAVVNADGPRPQAQEARAENPIIVELNDWIAVRKTNAVADLKMFLRRYPDGNFAEEASSRILDLEEQGRRLAGVATARPGPTSSAEQLPSAPSLADDLLYIRKGDQLLGQGKPDKAADEYRQAIKLNAGRAIYYGKLGIALYSQGKFKESEAEYKKALQLESFSATLFFDLGLALYRQQKFSDAEKSFRRAAQLNPNDAAFHMGLALSLAFQRKSAEAETEFRQAIKLDPINASYHANLGNVLIQLNKYTEAEAEYSKALKLDPANLQYKERLVQLRQRNQ